MKYYQWRFSTKITFSPKTRSTHLFKTNPPCPMPRHTLPILASPSKISPLVTQNWHPRKTKFLKILRMILNIPNSKKLAKLTRRRETQIKRQRPITMTLQRRKVLVRWLLRERRQSKHYQRGIDRGLRSNLFSRLWNHLGAGRTRRTSHLGWLCWHLMVLLISYRIIQRFMKNTKKVCLS